jgi:hypothetical protein
LLAFWQGLIIVCCLALSGVAADDLPRDWKRHLGLENEFTNSKFVFVGQVVSSKQVIDREGFIQGTFYVVRMEESLKGNPPKAVEIYDENSSGRFQMKKRERYLLFAYEDTFEGAGLRLAINNCGNSGTLRQIKKRLALLRELKKTLGKSVS